MKFLYHFLPLFCSFIEREKDRESDSERERDRERERYEVGKKFHSWPSPQATKETRE